VTPSQPAIPASSPFSVHICGNRAVISENNVPLARISPANIDFVLAALAALERPAPQPAEKR
jgi:hypothetical protein